MIKTTYLSASVPLTKTFELENGELKKTAHPRIIDVTSYEENFETIEEFYAQLVEHSKLGHSFLKGNVTRPLASESRAGSTNPVEPTQILLLDLDGLRDIRETEDFVRLLGLSDVDRIDQYSSSMGIVPDCGLRAHIFMLINKGWIQAMLKQWLIHKNLNIQQLRNNLSLTRTGNTLRWGLDVTTCQNDKLIYIAPPILGPGVEDTFQGERIKLIKGTKRTVNISETTIPTAEANRIEVEKVLNELRVKAGLPARKKVTNKVLHSIEYQTNSDRAVVTGIKIERGFVYLNINGGDSWAYYHAENNPEFIYNFKGEPIYRTSELLPEYWAEVREQQNIPSADPSGTMFLAIRDFDTACYFNGSYNEKERILSLKPAKSKDQLHDFLINNKQKIPIAIPDWKIVFEPSNDVIVSLEDKRINTFIASPYMAMQHRKILKVPPTIRKVIFNALGSDEEVFEHFMNSIACIFQYRTKTESSWIFHGIMGTGKGLMINHILRPLFGQAYVSVIRMRQLDNQFNEFMDNNLILWIDEAEITVLNNQAVISSDLKNYITEPNIMVRKMYSPNKYTPNYTTIMLAGNDGVMVNIPRGDRRFNVAPYQTQSLLSLGPTEGIIAKLTEELTDFAAYLATRNADQEKARIPLENLAKEKLVSENETAIEQACSAIKKGDFNFFWDLKSEQHLKPGASTMSRDILTGAYNALLEDIKSGKKKNLLREEIQTLFEYALGGMPTAPHKFISLIKHHKLIPEPISREGRTMRGIKIDWRIE